MKNIKFMDNRKKESLLWLILLFSGVLVLLWVILKDFVIFEGDLNTFKEQWFWYGFYITVIVYSAYQFLSDATYKLTLTEDKIYSGNIFKSAEIEYKEIESYVLAKMKKPDLYKIILNTNEKDIIIYFHSTLEIIDFLNKKIGIGDSIEGN